MVQGSVNHCYYDPIKRYICSATGALARPAANLHNAWVKASPRGDPLWPDIQLFFVSTTLATDVVLASSFYNLDAYVSSMHRSGIV